MLEELISYLVMGIIVTLILLPILKKLFKQDWKRIVLVQIVGYFLMLYPNKTISADLYDWITENAYPPKWIMSLEHYFLVILFVLVPAIYAEFMKVKRRIISTLIVLAPLGIVFITLIVLIIMKQMNL